MLDQSLLPEARLRDNSGVQRDDRKGEQGFTLIEVLIALLLLLIGVAGVLSLQMVSMRATSYSRHATEATIVAEDKMEELMLVEAADIIHGDSDIVDSQGVDAADGDYNRSWTAVVPETPGTIAIEVTVQWFEKGTESHQISITTERQL